MVEPLTLINFVDLRAHWLQSWKLWK